MNSIRLLLVEADPADAALLGTALQEIEECRYWRNWHHADVLHVECLTDALDLLRTERFDVILLDLELPDSRRSRTFLPVCALAPQIPIILLSTAADEPLAARLIREGAQDFLLKEHVDCHPLARAIENAIERNRILVATRSALLTDTWTGLPNEAGFHTFGEQMRRTAARFGLSLMVVAAEPDSDSTDTERSEAQLLEAASRLRGVLAESDVLARVGENRLGLLIAGRSIQELEAIYQRIQLSPVASRIRFGSASLDRRFPVPVDELLRQAERDLDEAIGPRTTGRSPEASHDKIAAG